MTKKNIYYLLILYHLFLSSAFLSAAPSDDLSNKKRIDSSYKELIAAYPKNLENALYNGLKKIASETVIEDELHFQVLEGGFSSSKLFTFILNQEKYVLRILNPKNLDTPAINFNRRLNEVLAHKSASKLAIAPELIYSDPEALIIIMKYIDGHTLEKSDLKNTKILRQLGVALKKLHNCTTILPSKRLQMERVRIHYMRAQQKEIAFPSSFQSLYKEYIQQANRSTTHQVLCHGDLNLANILIANEQVYFIDWTGATYENPYTDLGYLTLLSGMDTQQIDVFLEAYLERKATQWEKNQLLLAQANTCFVTASVWLDFSESQHDKKIPVTVRVDQLDQLLHSPVLKQGSEYILRGQTVNPISALAIENRLFYLGFLQEYLTRKKNLSALY